MTDSILLEPGDGARLRSLRILLGYTRLRDFTAALDTPGLSFDTLGEVERGTRPLSDEERAAITDFAQVGRNWFTAPIREFGDPTPGKPKPGSQLDRVEQMQGSMLGELRAIRLVLEAKKGPLADLLAATAEGRELEAPPGGDAPTPPSRRR